MKKSILIGSNGYLGKHLAYFLKENNFHNFNFDIHPEPPEEIENYQTFNITRKKEFDKLDPNVDFIFLFAGLTGTANGFENFKKFISVNELGLLNLLLWMRKSGCNARIIFPSTRLVYKGRKNYMLKESEPKETKTIYALNKLAAENILWMHYNAFGIDNTIFRICIPYGNHFDEHYSYGTIGFFFNKARKGEDIILYGNGSIRRTFTHVEDICNYIIRAIQIEKTKNQIFNIGGENLSLLEAAKIVAQKYDVSINFVEWPDMALKLESDDTVFDDSKLKALIDYTNKYTIKSWLSGF